MYYITKFFRGGFALGALHATNYLEVFLFILAFFWFVFASPRSGCFLD